MSRLLSWRLALGLGLSLAASATAATSDHLVHQWSFNDGTAKDCVGGADGTLHGNAWIGNGALYLRGSSLQNYMMTSPIGTALNDRTLVAWCSIEDLGAITDCAGSVISVVDESYNPTRFDGIVFGERTASQWMSGSDFWVRTPENNGGALETVEAPHMVMMAITYSASPYRVTIYRNGELYATHTYESGRYSPALTTLTAAAKALIGPRSTGSGAGFFNGYIDEARIYDAALTAEEIAEIYAEGPAPCPISTPWNGSFEIGSPFTGFPADYTGNPQDDVEKTRMSQNWVTLAGWFDEPTGYSDLSFIEVVNQWWCCYPTDGYTQMWLEISNPNKGANSQTCPAIQTGPLGNIVAGESYRIQADFSSGPNATWKNINYANIELIDVQAGDAIAQWSQIIPTTYTTVACDFTTPVMDASRHGHAVRLRLAVPTFLDSHDEGVFQNQFAVDNVRLTVIPGAAPTPGEAVYTQVDDGVFSQGDNWQGGAAPKGAVSKLTFKSRQTAETMVSMVEVDTALWVSNLVVESEHSHCTRVIEETDGGRLSLYANGGVPTADIGTGLTRIRQLSAPNGFVKTGAGTLQVGGFRALGGTIDIREGRVTVGDELAHRWSFNDGTGRDLCGPADGTLNGAAAIVDGELVIPGTGSSFITSDLGQKLSNDTLVVWTRLDDPTVSTMGSALSVCDKRDFHCSFNGIVYGEKTPQYWMAGSESWHRSKDAAGQGSTVAETSTNEVMMAISFNERNAGAVYIARNGEQYGSYVAVGCLITPPTAFAMIGPRHYGHTDTYVGAVNEARIYRFNLSVRSLQALAAAGPNAGSAYLGRMAEIPAGAKVRLGGAGTVFDLNMNAQSVDELAGSGEVRNGTLTVRRELTVDGELTIDGDLVLGEGCMIRYTSGEAKVVVKGKITLPGYAKMEFAFDKAKTGMKKMLSAGVKTDWSPLSCWNIPEPEVKGFKFTEIQEKQPPSYFGFLCESDGCVVILR